MYLGTYGSVPTAEQPWWFYAAGVVALVGLLWLLWNARTTLRGESRDGFPDVRPRDTSDRTGPQTRVGELMDPHAGTRRRSPRDDEPGA
jgi:hypothetical protein